MSARALLLGGALACALLGCDTTQDCPLILDAIAPHMARIEQKQRPEADAPSVAELRALSADYAALAAALEHVEPSATRAKAGAKEYQEASTGLAEGYELLAKALEAADDVKLKTAKETLTSWGRSERRTLREIGAMCESR